MTPVKDVHRAVTNLVPSHSELQLLHRELWCEALSSVVLLGKMPSLLKVLELFNDLDCLYCWEVSSLPAICSVQKWPCSHMTSSVTASGPETNRCD